MAKVFQIDESELWYQVAEMNTPPIQVVKNLQPAKKATAFDALWAGALILAACSALGYAFWAEYLREIFQ